MKNSGKITLCGIIAALSVVFMLLSYFPYFTYAAPAVTGLFTIMLVIELNKKWAFGSYVTASVLFLLLAEKESALFYILLFGYYPILKALIEQIGKMVLEWIIKMAVFNGSVLLLYGVFSYLFQISLEDFGELGFTGAVVFLVLANIAFVLYDIAISRVSTVYMAKLHGRINKIIK